MDAIVFKMTASFNKTFLWQSIHDKNITAGTNLFDVKARLENGVQLLVQTQALRVVAIKQIK